MFYYCFDTEKAHFLVLLGEMGVTAVVLGILQLQSHKATRSRLLWRSNPKAGTLWNFICDLLHHLIQKHLWGQLQAILLLTRSTRHWGYLSVPFDPVRKALRLHKLLLKPPFSGANTRNRKNTCNLTSLQMLGALSQAASHRLLLRAYGTDPIHKKIPWHFGFETSYRIFLDKIYCTHHICCQISVCSHENLLLLFKIVPRAHRWCNWKHGVGAASGLLVTITLLSLSWRTSCTCSTVQDSLLGLTLLVDH